MDNLPGDTIILWADAYDVIYQGDAADFLPRYHELLSRRGMLESKGNITIFNAEQKCSPFKNLGLFKLSIYSAKNVN